MTGIDLRNIAYVGYDVVGDVVRTNARRHPSVSFRELDITQEIPAVADVVFVKDLFQHLTDHEIACALHNIHASGSRYLMVNSDTYPPPLVNSRRPTGDKPSCPVNLSAPPFCEEQALFTVRLDRKYYMILPLNTRESSNVIRGRLARAIEDTYAALHSTLPDVSLKKLEGTFSVIGCQNSTRVMANQAELWIPGDGLMLDPPISAMLSVFSADERVVAHALSDVYERFSETALENEAPGAAVPRRRQSSEGQVAVLLMIILGLVRLVDDPLSNREVEATLVEVGAGISRGWYSGTIERMFYQATANQGACALYRRRNDIRYLNSMNRHYRLSTGHPVGPDVELAAFDIDHADTPWFPVNAAAES